MATLGVERLELRALLSAMVSDALTFGTADQSLWAPGTDPVAGASFEYVLPVVPESTPPRTFGGISSVNNPLADAWDTAVVVCQALLPDVLGLDDNCASYVKDGVTIGPILGFGPFEIPGLGARPPERVNNGTLLTVDGALAIGVGGSVEVTPGNVDVNYPTTAKLEVLDDTVLPGELFTIRTSETPGSPTLSTAFSEIDASIRGIIDASASFDLDQYILGLHTINIDEGFDTGKLSQEIFGVTIGDSVELRPLGQPIEIHPGPIGASINIPALPPPLSSFVGFPLADVQIMLPDLDTPPHSSFDGQKITNTHLPVTRTGGGVTPIDFAKLDLDVDSLSLLAGLPLGIEIGVPLAATFEINILDTDLGAFFGIAQTMTFDAELMVDLHFSTPAQVETSPGVFEARSVYRTRVGENVNIIHPGGELSIDPVYTVANNVFTNDTDLMLSPAFTVNFLQLQISGVLTTLLGIAGDFHVFQNTFALGNPEPIASIFDGQFSLQGFNTAAGSRLLVPSLVPPEIDETSLVVDPASALEGSPVTFSGSFADPNTGESHTVAIDWGDGSDATIVFVAAGNPKSFSASHAYPDNGAYPIAVSVTDDADKSDSADASVVVNNVAPSVVLTGSSLNLDAAGNPIPLSGVRGQTLDFSVSFSDPGFDNLPRSSETFSYQIDYGDGTVTPWQPAGVNVVGSPGVPTTGTLPGSHLYTDAGDYPIAVRVKDDDGDITEVTQTVHIAVASLQAGGVLAVGGSTACDDLRFIPGAAPGQIEVLLNGASLGTFLPTSQLMAFGQAGDDDLQAAGSINLPVYLAGDAGDDRLKGGGGNDVLLGGDGDDLLVGQSGRDLLLGGDGDDRIIGNSDDDLLISGMLSFADQDAAIAAIMAEWTSSHSYATRIANLSGKTDAQGNADFASRFNDDYFLTIAVTVLDDDDHDTLTGSAGEDWFWFDPELDKVTDLGDEAFADDLGFIMN